MRLQCLTGRARTLCLAFVILFNLFVLLQMFRQSVSRPSAPEQADVPSFRQRSQLEVQTLPVEFDIPPEPIQWSARAAHKQIYSKPLLRANLRSGEDPCDIGFCSYRRDFAPVTDEKDLKRRLSALKKAAAHQLPPVFNLSSVIASTHVTQCDGARRDAWLEAHADLLETNEYLAPTIERNRKSGWGVVAVEALRKAVAAFATVDLPPILSGPSLLSWHLVCNFTEYDDDIHLAVPADYLMSDEHLFLLQEALRLRGFSESELTYGIPTKAGFEQLFYYTTPSDVTVNVVVFFGQPDGGDFVEAIWGRDRYWCPFPNTGFQRVRFADFTLLAPKDPVPILETLYGSGYEEPPKGGSGYRHCRTSRSYLQVEGRMLPGMFQSYDGLCDASSPECVSPFGRDLLVRKLLAFFQALSEEAQLSYTPVCETLKFMVERQRVPPGHASVGVYKRDLPQWLSLLKTRVKTTTFRIRTEDDGSLFHVMYSLRSPVRLVVWSLPPTTELVLETLKYPRLSGSLQSVAKDDPNTADLLTMCPPTCVFCEAVASHSRISGPLRNAEYEKCMATTTDEKVSLSSCRQSNEWEWTAAMELQHVNTSLCLDVTKEAYEIILAPCRSTPPVTQQWHYDDASMQIVHLASSLCLEPHPGYQHLPSGKPRLRRCSAGNQNQRWTWLEEVEE